MLTNICSGGILWLDKEKTYPIIQTVLPHLWVDKSLYIHTNSTRRL